MRHLDILATPKKYDESGKWIESDYFYVPSLVKTVEDKSYLSEGLETRALGISFKFHSSVLPPAIGYRLIASCVDMFELKSQKGMTMLYSGMAVFRVKRNLDLLVMLRFDRVDLFCFTVLKDFQLFETPLPAFLNVWQIS